MRVLLLLPLVLYAAAAAALLVLRFFPPPLTMVQLQRRIEARIGDGPAERARHWRPLRDLPPHVSRAVVAAEDTRFFEHRGFDWVEFDAAAEQARRTGRARRGASTISQQLVKNLFLTTHRSFVRKGAEYALTPLAELLLGKDRILELYLNVIEWGPGVYGIEAAARHHYDTSASRLSREQALRLAAIVPAPRTRNPRAMSAYARTIDSRMRVLGW